MELEEWVLLVVQGDMGVPITWEGCGGGWMGGPPGELAPANGR